MTRFETTHQIPEQRLVEIAGIFARSFMRLQQRRNQLPQLSEQTALEMDRQDLEQSAKMRLSVTRGLRSESPEPRRS